LNDFILDNILTVIILRVTAYRSAKAVGNYFKSEKAVEATAVAIEDGIGSVPEDNSLPTRRRTRARTALDWLKKLGSKYKNNKKGSVCGWS
jgi:hypothetical protein